jgi:hypothetical protein
VQEGGGQRIESEGELIALAAHGSERAQTLLVHLCLVRSGTLATQEEATAAAEAFARMAAHNRVGNGVLLGQVLMLRADCAKARGDLRLALGYQAEAQGWFAIVEEEGDAEDRAGLLGALSGLADGGDEASAVRLNGLLESLPAQEAAKLRASAKQQLSEGEAFAAQLIRAEHGDQQR